MPHGRGGRTFWQLEGGRTGLPLRSTRARWALRRAIHHEISESQRASGRLRPLTPAPKPGSRTSDPSGSDRRVAGLKTDARTWLPNDTLNSMFSQALDAVFAD